MMTESCHLSETMTATYELQIHIRLDVQIEIQLQLLATDVRHTLDLMLAGSKEIMI